MALRGCSNAK